MPPAAAPVPRIRLLDSTFVKSASALAGAPPPDLPEVCFVGRSNVGKSSAINALLGRRKLARVSHTPGRTRLLNFFEVRLAVGDERRVLSFCDLPGYGFAKASKSETATWRAMIESYLLRRASLRTVVSLVDARHEPSELDVALIGWLRDQRRPFRVVATKADKIARPRVAATLAGIERALGLPARSALAFSAHTGQGRDDVLAALVAACQ